jgi:hypothetical protein
MMPLWETTEGEAVSSSSALKMEAAGSSEMLVTTYVTMQCHMTEDGDLRNFCCWHSATSCKISSV